MSVSVRSLGSSLVPGLVPGVALAAAGVVALSPALVAPPALIRAQPVVEVPAVHVGEIALAGIGRDIYNSITNFVQYTVSSAQYWIGLVPVIGPPIADQIGITYFTLIQPVIQSTVYYLSDIIANPFAFVQLTANYGSNLFYAGYSWVSQELQAFGLPPLVPIPPPPPLAATRGGAAAVEAPAASAAVAEVPGASRGAAVVAGVIDAPVEAPAEETPVVESPGELRTGARSARQGTRGASAAAEAVDTGAAVAERKSRATRSSAPADDAAGAEQTGADEGAAGN